MTDIGDGRDGPASPPPSPAGRRVFVPRAIDKADLAIPGADARRFALSGETMGTSWSAVFYAPPDFTPGHVSARIEAALERTIAQMSLWRGDSLISRFNAAPAGALFVLPEPFLSVLAAALDLAADTGGAFDPTLGELTDLWGFGPGGARGRPDRDALSAARAAAGWSRVDLDRETGRLRQPGGLRLDLNAIAKGDAVDRLGAAMDACGLQSWLAEIGGELRGRGLKPGGAPWWTALETGGAPEAGETEAVAALTGLSIATSGAYRRTGRDAAGGWSHLIDPARGEAAPGALQAVTVLAKTCLRADALATALFVMGPERGMAFAEARGVAALFAEGPEPERQHLSPALRAMLD